MGAALCLKPEELSMETSAFEERLLRGHREIVAGWDGLGPTRVLLIASGGVGVEAARRLLRYPLDRLALCAVTAADREPLIRLLVEKKGRAVREAQLAPGSLYEDSWSGALLARYQMVALAEDRPHPDLLERLDGACAHLGLPWTRLSVWGAELFLGPTVLPGLTACYRCFTRRWLANEKRLDTWRAQDQFLRNDPGFEFGGFLGPVRTLGAALLTSEVLRLLGSGPPPVAVSRIRIENVLTGARVSELVIPVPGCPVCRQQRSGVSGSREMAELAQRISERVRRHAHAER